MDVSVKDAEARLDELVDRAQAGEEVIITVGGRRTVRLTPVDKARRFSSEEMMAAIDAIVAVSSKKALPGPSAARSQDFLYGDDGLPV